MICPTCKTAMLKCNRTSNIYWYCAKCKCTVETTSSTDYSTINYYVPKYEREELIDTSQMQIFK